MVGANHSTNEGMLSRVSFSVSETILEKTESSLAFWVSLPGDSNTMEIDWGVLL